MQQAVKSCADCDWFGFNLFWPQNISIALRSHPCVAYCVFVLKQLPALICICAALLHRLPWIMLTVKTKGCTTGLNLCVTPVLCPPIRPCFLFGWESTLSNYRLSSVVPAEAPWWQRLSTERVKKTTQKNFCSQWAASYFPLYSDCYFIQDFKGATLNASSGLSHSVAANTENVFSYITQGSFVSLCALFRQNRTYFISQKSTKLIETIDMSQTRCGLLRQQHWQTKCVVGNLLFQDCVFYHTLSNRELRMCPFISGFSWYTSFSFLFSN